MNAEYQEYVDECMRELRSIRKWRKEEGYDGDQDEPEHWSSKELHQYKDEIAKAKHLGVTPTVGLKKSKEDDFDRERLYSSSLRETVSY